MSTKPALSSFNTLAEIMIQTYERYLPTAFDESLTLLEKTNKVIEYLNQTGKVTNDVVKQWNEVMEWLMNGGMSEDVDRKIDEMVSSGVMDTIINQSVFSGLNNKIENIAIQVDDFTGTDDEKFQQALNLARGLSAKILFSSGKDYVFNNSYVIDFPLTLEGAIGVFTFETNLIYNGTGTFLHFKHDSTKKGYGNHIKNLTIHGNPLAKSGIKVNMYDNVGTGMRGFTLENVIVKRFVNGWGVDIGNAYGNTLHNCTLIQNGANLRLKNAHATSVFGGAIEGSIFGISVEGSRPVNFYGTAIEGYVTAQVAELNGAIPSDFLIWDGWTQKTGGSYLPVTWQRTAREHFVGTGLRNLASTVNLHGCYFELNVVSVLNELESVTNVFGCWIEVVQDDKCFADLGHGQFTMMDSNIKLETTDTTRKLINLSNLEIKELCVMRNKMADTSRLFGGHMAYRGVYTNNSDQWVFNKKTINTGGTLITKNVTKGIATYNFVDNYSALIQNVEKVEEENMYITGDNAYLTLHFNPANLPVISEGSTKKIIFKTGARACRVTFGNNFQNVPSTYTLVDVGKTLAGEFVYVAGKLVCTSLIQS